MNSIRGATDAESARLNDSEHLASLDGSETGADDSDGDTPPPTAHEVALEVIAEMRRAARDGRGGAGFASVVSAVQRDGDSDFDSEDDALPAASPPPPQLPPLSPPPPPLQQDDPFPWREVAVIAMINSVNSASYLMTYPFVSFMILSFDASLRPEEVGFYSGISEGAFHVGSVFGSIGWGHYADVKGRRPALLTGLLGTIAATLSFGFARNFAMAVATRFAWGLLNGNVGVAKTSMSEVCSDRHTARAFAYIGLANGFGRILGPAIGGLLAEPVRKYGWKSELLERFPFALPCLIAAMMTLITLVLAYAVLKETLPSAQSLVPTPAFRAPKSRSDAETRAAADVDSDDASAGEAAPADDESEAATMLGKAPVVAASVGITAQLGSSRVDAQPSSAVDAAAHQKTPESPLSSIARLMRDPPVASCVLLYCGLGCIGLVSQELYPLYVINDRAHGGFGLDSSAIGLLALSGGPWMIASQAFLFERCTAALGVLRVNEVSLLLFALCMATTPLQSFAAALPESALWSILVVHYGLTTFIRVTCFTCTFLFVANSALPSDRGKVNGLGQAAVSVFRAIGPPLGTAVFAWSVKDERPWPFNYSLTWLLLSAAVLGLVALSRRLPRWIERKRLAGDVADDTAPPKR
jgi:hypothetical protein